MKLTVFNIKLGALVHSHNQTSRFLSALSATQGLLQQSYLRKAPWRLDTPAVLRVGWNAWMYAANGPNDAVALQQSNNPVPMVQPTPEQARWNISTCTGCRDRFVTAFLVEGPERGSLLCKRCSDHHHSCSHIRNQQSALQQQPGNSLPVPQHSRQWNISTCQGCRDQFRTSFMREAPGGMLLCRACSTQTDRPQQAQHTEQQQQHRSNVCGTWSIATCSSCRHKFRATTLSELPGTSMLFCRPCSNALDCNVSKLHSATQQILRLRHENSGLLAARDSLQSVVAATRAELAAVRAELASRTALDAQLAALRAELALLSASDADLTAMSAVECTELASRLEVQLARVKQAQMEKVERQSQCAICWTNAKEIVFNCGHQSCMVCSTQLEQQQQPCPFCREEITLRIKLYDS